MTRAQWEKAKEPNTDAQVRVSLKAHSAMLGEAMELLERIVGVPSANAIPEGYCKCCYCAADGLLREWRGKTK